MQEDFHYYATYCAAALAGFGHEECLTICHSAQLVDHCSATYLKKLHGPSAAVTTQLQLELMEARTDISGLADITRIWASFHFLPGDLYREVERGSKRYKNKYRLICGPNGALLADTVELACGRGLEAAGIAMHVLADTWAHTWFAGTPSLVINNTNYHFYELLPSENGYTRRQVAFGHNPASADDPETGKYIGSLYQSAENSIMNLGHGRAGHLPDYSYIRYAYLPAWGNYREIIKDNPKDYDHAFRQMVYALKYLRGQEPDFETDTYDTESVDPYASEIREIIETRRLDASEDWKRLGERLTGGTIPDFDMDAYRAEYERAADKEETLLGRFFAAAIRQKQMVSAKILESGNPLAGKKIRTGRKQRGAS